MEHTKNLPQKDSRPAVMIKRILSNKSLSKRAKRQVLAGAGFFDSEITLLLGVIQGEDMVEMLTPRILDSNPGEYPAVFLGPFETLVMTDSLLSRSLRLLVDKISPVSKISHIWKQLSDEICSNNVSSSMNTDLPRVVPVQPYAPYGALALIGESDFDVFNKIVTKSREHNLMLLQCFDVLKDVSATDVTVPLAKSLFRDSAIDLLFTSLTPKLRIDPSAGVIPILDPDFINGVLLKETDNFVLFGSCLEGVFDIIGDDQYFPHAGERHFMSELQRRYTELNSDFFDRFRFKGAIASVTALPLTVEPMPLYLVLEGYNELRTGLYTVAGELEGVGYTTGVNVESLAGRTRISVKKFAITVKIGDSSQVVATVSIVDMPTGYDQMFIGSDLDSQNVKHAYSVNTESIFKSVLDLEDPYVNIIDCSVITKDYIGIATLTLQGESKVMASQLFKEGRSMEFASDFFNARGGYVDYALLALCTRAFNFVTFNREGLSVVELSKDLGELSYRFARVLNIVNSNSALYKNEASLARFVSVAMLADVAPALAVLPGTEVGVSNGTTLIPSPRRVSLNHIVVATSLEKVFSRRSIYSAYRKGYAVVSNSFLTDAFRMATPSLVRIVNRDEPRWFVPFELPPPELAAFRHQILTVDAVSFIDKVNFARELMISSSILADSSGMETLRTSGLINLTIARSVEDLIHHGKMLDPNVKLNVLYEDGNRVQTYDNDGDERYDYPSYAISNSFRYTGDPIGPVPENTTR